MTMYTNTHMFSLTHMRATSFQGSTTQRGVQTRILRITPRSVTHRTRFTPITMSNTCRTDRMTVAEKLNGRMAMVGYLAGGGYEIVTGMNYIDQLRTSWAFVVILAAVLGIATLYTRDITVSDEKPFTPNQELLNGRLAMLGMLAKFAYDIQGMY